MDSITHIASVQIPVAALADIREQATGTILIPGDATYDNVRKIWNGMIDRKPAMIFQCQSVNDIILGIKTARRYNLPIAIRGGGHNVSGNAVCDDGVMIDLSVMKKVQVDPEQLTAKAQTGATWGDFDKATQVFGLATTGGVISTTGIAGLTLGGGVGWLVRHYGMSCDNVISAEMVTADGELVVANNHENPDLFWGIRGGGGNFGVVTSLTYRLHPVAKVFGGMILHPRQEAKKLIQFYREYMKTAPNELTLYTGLLHTPDGVPVVAFMGCYSGDIERAADVLKPVLEFGSPIVNLMQEQPYQQMQTMLDGPFPHGNRYYWKSGFLEALSDEAIDTILEYAETTPSLGSAVLLELYGGKASQEPVGGTAYPHRQNLYDLVIGAHWTNPEEDENNLDWARSFWQALQPFSSNRVYVNTLGMEGEKRVKEAYGESYERLLTLKRKYDPENIFRMNQNIDPQVD